MLSILEPRRMAYLPRRPFRGKTGKVFMNCLLAMPLLFLTMHGTSLVPEGQADGRLEMRLANLQSNERDIILIQLIWGIWVLSENSTVNQIISNTGFESPCSTKRESSRFSPLDTPSVLYPPQEAGLTLKKLMTRGIEVMSRRNFNGALNTFDK